MESILASIISTASLADTACEPAVNMSVGGSAKFGACHAVGRNIIDPSFMDVSAKYRRDKATAGKIAAGIIGFAWIRYWNCCCKRHGCASEAQIKSMPEFIAGWSK